MMPEIKSEAKSNHQIENDNLKKALRFVFEKQKKTNLEFKNLKSDNEKLSTSLQKQAASIPELQIQNRVLQQQLKTLIQDLHHSENKLEDASEKSKQFKLKFLSSTKRLRFTRAILFFSFISITGLIWQSYRDNESNKKMLQAFQKVSDENEALLAQNKVFFDEQETFQANLYKKYQNQIENINNQLSIVTKEKFYYHEKLSQAIENFSQQTKDLKQEHLSLLNFTKNNYENKISALLKEKKNLKDHLLESEIKNREIVINEPEINELKHNNFINNVKTESKEKSNSKTEKNATPKNNSEFDSFKDQIPEDETDINFELNGTTPFKMKISPF